MRILHTRAPRVVFGSVQVQNSDRSKSVWTSSPNDPMKRISFAFLLLFLSTQGLVVQKRRQVLFDFRTARPLTSSKMSAQTRLRILSQLFRKYLDDENKCNARFDPSGSVDQLQAARNAGQIVPLIVDDAQGSFTARGRTETAYVIAVGECNASHAENYGTKRVAIFAGDKLIADMDVNFKNSIVRKTDLNGDGIDELLMTTGDMAQGTLIEIGGLLDFEAGKVRVIEDFGTVVEDSCASGFQGSSSRASVISFSGEARGKFPKLRIDNYESGCRKVKRWRFVSTGKSE